MVVRELISDLERGNPDWSRPDLLDIVNKCYRILMWHPAEFTRAIDSEGRDPEITPATNTITVDDAYQILAVYVSHGGYHRWQASDGLFSHTVGKIQGNTVTFTDSEVDGTYRIAYYKKTPDYTTESEELIFPEEQLDVITALCNERISYDEHQSLSEWYNAKKEITKNFWYYLNKYQNPTHLNDRNQVSRDSYLFGRSRYGRGRYYGR